MVTNINRRELSFQLIKKMPDDFTCHTPEAEKFKLLLYSIATKLGLNEKESKDLAEYVCLIGERNYGDQKENFTLKIWLSKILVRNCVFKISSSLFSQTANNYLVAASMSKVPISFRTAYILFHSIGFTESEVAQILNITPMQVRERLAKAVGIIKASGFNPAFL